jgi:hypothetical protein
VTTSAPHTIGTAPPAAPGQRPPAQLSRIVRADWALWADWCTATDRDPHHGAIPDLASFLLELPATSGVQDRRVRSIVRTLTGAGHALPRPTTAAPVRTGPAWASHGDALATLRQEWHPEGVAARRDALILTLHASGFTPHPHHHPAPGTDPPLPRRGRRPGRTAAARRPGAVP